MDIHVESSVLDVLHIEPRNGAVPPSLLPIFGWFLNELNGLRDPPSVLQFLFIVNLVPAFELDLFPLFQPMVLLHRGLKLIVTGRSWLFKISI